MDAATGGSTCSNPGSPTRSTTSGNGTRCPCARVIWRRTVRMIGRRRRSCRVIREVSEYGGFSSHCSRWVDDDRGGRRRKEETRGSEVERRKLGRRVVRRRNFGRGQR